MRIVIFMVVCFNSCRAVYLGGSCPGNSPPPPPGHEPVNAPGSIGVSLNPECWYGRTPQ